jgi:hypothetical protein
MKHAHKFHTTRVRIPRILTAALAIIVFAPPGVPAATPIFSNVQVNEVFPGPFPKNKQNEPSLAQNPTNPSNLPCPHARTRHRPGVPSLRGSRSRDFTPRSTAAKRGRARG